MSADAAGTYDTIAYPDAKGEQKTLSKSDFEKLPLMDRIRLLSGGQLRFFRGGQEVAASSAMRR
jgi:hypothetical protein